jgi:dihydroorotate dehydrogenase (NAD+) catalytic subunit
VAGVSRTLAVDLGAGLVLPTPVMVAAGCAGTGRELAGLVELRKVGALVSRSVTVEPERGTPTPRIAETPSGIVWSTGLQNPGIDAFVRDELPRLARGGAHVLVSIAGSTLEEYVRLTGVLQGRPEVAAIETHLSAPDVEFGREELGVHADRAAEVVGAVARMSLVPTFAKLPLHAPAIGELARALVRAGAHGLTVGGPPPALGVQPERLRAALGSVTGWLSGPAVKPLMLRAVFEVGRAAPDVPVVASGGIRTGADAIEALLAGAWAVQVGTAMLIDPDAPVTVAQGVATYLKAKGLASPNDLRGHLRVPASFGAMGDPDDRRAPA